MIEIRSGIGNLMTRISRLLGRGKNEQDIRDPEEEKTWAEVRESLLERARTGVPICIQTLAEKGNPYFDLLPEVLEEAQNPWDVHIVLITRDLGYADNDPTLHAIYSLQWLALKRKSHGRMADIMFIKEHEITNGIQRRSA